MQVDECSNASRAEGRPGRRRHGMVSRHIRANVIGYLALFVALGGSAVAAQKLGPKDLRKNAVRAKHVKKKQVKAKHLANGAVKSNKLADGAVTADKLDPGAIPEFTIGNGSITTEKLANGAVTTQKLANGAVATQKLADDAVDASKLGANSVDTQSIQGGAVTNPKIANLAVDTQKLRDDAVTSAKIGPDQVRAADLGTLTRRTAFVEVNGGETASTTANCNAGEVAISGGGVWSLAPGDPLLSIQASFPTGNDPTGWTVRGANQNGAGSETLTLNVLCLQA